MTDTVPIEDLPAWGGCYVMDRAAREAPNGYDHTQALVEGKLRRAAREAGHEPVGRVKIVWEDNDPDAPVEGEKPPPDPDRVWAVAAVRVRPDAARTLA